MGTRFLGRHTFSLLLAALLIPFAKAQETAKAPTAAYDQAELEGKFKELLTNCTFDGHWCLVENGKLSEEKSEKYTITGATKSGQDVWLIYAKIHYRGRDVNVPVPVQVKWAGDTPVITLDKVTIPGMGTYSARVLVYDENYAGTWSASDHGGMLHGMIKKTEKKTE